MIGGGVIGAAMLYKPQSMHQLGKKGMQAILLEKGELTAPEVQSVSRLVLYRETSEPQSSKFTANFEACDLACCWIGNLFPPRFEHHRIHQLIFKRGAP